MSSPRHIREWFNEQKAIAGLPSGAPEVATVSAPRFKTQRDAEKFIKVDQRSSRWTSGRTLVARVPTSGSA